MSEDLKPCPFCGGEAMIVVDVCEPDCPCHAECQKCFTVTKAYYCGEDGAIKAWNTRA